MTDLQRLLSQDDFCLISVDSFKSAYKKEIEDIKAEIWEVCNNLTYKENYALGGAWGLRKALEIIDNHINGKEVKMIVLDLGDVLLLTMLGFWIIVGIWTLICIGIQNIWDKFNRKD